MANSGMRWAARRTTLEAWGHPPTRIKVVVGSVVLRNLDGVIQAVAAEPLDGDGRALGNRRAAVRTGAGWSIPLGNPPMVWFSLTVRRRQDPVHDATKDKPREDAR